MRNIFIWLTVPSLTVALSGRLSRSKSFEMQMKGLPLGKINDPLQLIACADYTAFGLIALSRLELKYNTKALPES